MKSLLPELLLVLLIVSGCANKPKPPPEPDMSHLVPVNQTTPAELEGKTILPAKTAIQQTKAGDEK